MPRTILHRRSIRQFADRPVPRELLERCVNAARLAPASANIQPLEFIVVTDPAFCQDLFPLFRWAAHLKGWSPPAERQPCAWIAILVNREIALPDYEQYDVAFAAAHIILTAQADGVASCAMGAFDNGKAREILGVPERYHLPLFVALGYPAEEAVSCELTDSFKYWRDGQGVHHVPKRRLEDLVHWGKF